MVLVPSSPLERVLQPPELVIHMTKAIMAATVFFLYATVKEPSGTGKAPEKRDGCQADRKEENSGQASQAAPLGGQSVPVSTGAKLGEPCEETSDCSQTGQAALDCVEGECTWPCEMPSPEIECDSAGGTCDDGHCFQGE